MVCSNQSNLSLRNVAMKKILFLLFFLCFSFSIFGQLTVEETKPVLSDTILQPIFIAPIPIDSIIAYGKNFVGKPYRYKTSTGAIFDCSGFLSFIFDSMNYKIPRSSGAIFNFSKPIELKDVKKGDMLFFKGRNLENKRIGHVSLVIDVNERGPIMMHSSRHGIVIEEYKKAYYKARFLNAGRLPFFNFEELGKIMNQEMVIDTSAVNLPLH